MNDKRPGALAREKERPDIAFMSATQLARLLRGRKVGCLELLDYYLRRVERLNSRINAIVVRDFETARKRARRMDARMKKGGGGFGPLAGVPMTIKESYDLEGQPTTWGLEARKSHRAQTNAIAVQRMLDAGANIFGKTNVPVSLADWQTFNPIYGTTNNPWDLGCTPGGSSGGSAAALASGLTALEMGSDVGASIRNPAHYCGVFGHKPTWGICSRRGHELGKAAEPDISVIGPLARSAADLSLTLGIMAGPDAIDGAGWKVELPKPRPARLRDYRVAVMIDDKAAEVDRSVSSVIQGVGDFLRREKAKVSFEARPAIDTDEAHELYVLLFRASNSGGFSDERLKELIEEDSRLVAGERGYRAWFVRAAAMLHRDWLRLSERRHQMRLAWAEFFKDWDVLICPAAATAAFPHNQKGERWERMISVNGMPQPSTTQLFWAGYASAMLLPGTVAPAGLTAEGLPVGVQIIGPQYSDLTTIALAGWLEREYRPFVPPPGFE